MDFRIIEYNSAEYDKMVELRYEVLRKPLGMAFSEEDLRRDKNDLLLTVWFPDKENMAGCCILSSTSKQTVQLRQMAVSGSLQGNGIGRKLLAYAEQTAKNYGYEYVYLHAREVAVGFYKKQEYTIVSDLFMEIGIPHFEMLKKITG